MVILISNFELHNLKEIPKFHTKWQIREEKYRKIILTDTLEIHIIELPKLIKQLKENKGNKKDKIAKKLKELKMPIEQIAQVTGLTEKEIKNI